MDQRWKMAPEVRKAAETLETAMRHQVRWTERQTQTVQKRDVAAPPACVGGGGGGTCPGSRRAAALPDSPPGLWKARLLWVKVGQHAPPEQRKAKSSGTSRRPCGTPRRAPATLTLQGALELVSSSSGVLVAE